MNISHEDLHAVLCMYLMEEGKKFQTKVAATIFYIWDNYSEVLRFRIIFRTARMSAYSYTA
jgi:hypothetical protein